MEEGAGTGYTGGRGIRGDGVYEGMGYTGGRREEGNLISPD